MSGDAFAARVADRVRSRLLVRRAVLAVAVVIGAAIAAEPLIGLVVSLANEITDVLPQIDDPAWVFRYRTPLAAGLVLLALPGLIAWLER